jgi:hypothetical protein
MGHVAVVKILLQNGAKADEKRVRNESTLFLKILKEKVKDVSLRSWDDVKRRDTSII